MTQHIFDKVSGYTIDGVHVSPGDNIGVFNVTVKMQPKINFISMDFAVDPIKPVIGDTVLVRLFIDKMMLNKHVYFTGIVSYGKWPTFGVKPDKQSSYPLLNTLVVVFSDEIIGVIPQC